MHLSFIKKNHVYNKILKTKNRNKNVRVKKVNRWGRRKKFHIYINDKICESCPDWGWVWEHWLEL
jgi:hypothetical protein